MRYTSDELFHFVGLRDPNNHEVNFQTLLKILDARVLSFPPHKRFDTSRTLNWEANFEAGELLVPEVTCFCDIPRESLAIHMKKYGSFGVSFHRRFLVKYGARPVTYIPLQARDAYREMGTQRILPIIREWLISRQGFYDLVVSPVEGTVDRRTVDGKPWNRTDAILRIDDLLTEHFFAYLKVFDADLLEDWSENYYTEREWRKLGNLKFNSNDVVSVVIHPDYVERLASNCPEYAVKAFRADGSE